MNRAPSNALIGFGLFFAIFLWGGNNAGTKFLVQSWPPIFVGCTRFLLAGVLLLLLMRWTRWFGPTAVMEPELKKRLWLRGGLPLALYILAFNCALTYTSVARVVLYLGTAPIWALVLEERPGRTWRSAQRYGAALLGLLGVFVLFWPALKSGTGGLLGDVLALAASWLWTLYGRQCRTFGSVLSGAAISAHTFWRAALLLSPLALMEISSRSLSWETNLLLVQAFCVLGGGIGAFAIWNSALRHWPTSRVYLFINLIPLSSMTWANVFLGEPITPTFWLAMLLIVSGVLIGQTNWQKVLGRRLVPLE